MPVTTLTSRDFHQNSAKVKRAAERGPVIITDRGKPTLVVQTYEEYEKQHTEYKSAAAALTLPGIEDLDLPLPERRSYKPRELDW